MEKAKGSREKQKRVAVLLTVFGDESSDETGSRVFAVAGIIGRKEEWEELEKEWIKRTGGIIFHAADCDSDRGDFATTGHENNKKLYKDLTNILSNTKLMGHGVAIDLAGYRSNFHTKWKSPHTLCVLLE